MGTGYDNASWPGWGRSEGETVLDTAPCITFGLIIGGKITSGFVHSTLSVDGIYVDGQMSVLSWLVLEDL